MQKAKFDQMVGEFPFLKTILAEISFQVILKIEVARGDRNLLEVTPGARLFEDQKSVRSDYRWFWTVDPKGAIGSLPNAWIHMIGLGITERRTAPRIGFHLASSMKDFEYVVEVSQVSSNGDNFPIMVTVYKMNTFNILDDATRLIRNGYLR